MITIHLTLRIVAERIFTMTIIDFNRTIDAWIEELSRYDFTELCYKPSAGSWSVGQVYMHLIGETRFFLKQAEICAGNDESEREEALPVAKAMFFDNSFPDMQLEGPPSNAATPQPESKEQLMKDLFALKEQVNRVGQLSAASSFRGKTKHEGLHYFNAREWMQFAEMHFRHHLRQKKRIDDFLLKQKHN